MSNFKSLLSEATKFVYGTLLEFTWPAFDFLQQVRPVIFLPFNIWFFFVSLPFRIFFFMINGFTSQSSKISVEDKKTLDSKETSIPSIMVSKATDVLRQRKSGPTEDRPFSWYTVTGTVTGSVKSEEPVKVESAKGSLLDEFKSQLEEIQHMKEEVMPKEIQVDQSEELKGRLEEFEQREKAVMEEKHRLESQLEELSSKYYANEKSVALEKERLESEIKQLSSKHASDDKAALEEKKRLESQLKDLTEKFNVDEKALATFQTERSRLKQMVEIQLRKSFDFQQDIIGLKNQLKYEHECRIKAQEELESIKKQVESGKKSSTQSKSTPVSTPVVEYKPSEEVKPAWHVQHHENDYTQMVANAQHEQQDSKSFSEVVKESLDAKPSTDAKQVEEFVVVGGDLSNKHIVVDEVASTPAVESTPVVESKSVEEAKPVWHVPHHENDYTEMIANAQHEQQDHKSFSDILKDSLEVKPVEPTATADEFTVVGGDLANKHIVLDTSVAPSVNAI